MYWPLLNMYSENFGFGLGGFYYWGDLFKSGEVIISISKASMMANPVRTTSTTTQKSVDIPMHSSNAVSNLAKGYMGT